MSDMQNTVCPKCMLAYLHTGTDGCPKCERDRLATIFVEAALSTVDDAKVVVWKERVRVVEGERDHEHETATRLFDEVGRLQDLLKSHERAGLRLEKERDEARAKAAQRTDDHGRVLGELSEMMDDCERAINQRDAAEARATAAESRAEKAEGQVHYWDNRCREVEGVMLKDHDRALAAEKALGEAREALETIRKDGRTDYDEADRRREPCAMQVADHLASLAADALAHSDAAGGGTKGEEVPLLDALRWGIMGYFVKRNDEDASKWNILRLWKQVDVMDSPHPFVSQVNPMRLRATVNSLAEVEAWIRNRVEEKRADALRAALTKETPAVDEGKVTT